ncbi:MAG: hypothetical protein LC746_14430 [Acidobacteria bacterium]|nr:hypothetical protein [Acidobacteriota bacterium]
MRTKFYPSRLLIAAAACAALAPISAGQAPSPQPAAKPPAAEAAKPGQAGAQQQQPAWRLTVSKEQPRTVTLTAKNARAADVAAELAKRLSVPVLLSPLMQKQRLTLEFENVPLEGALRMLAPQPYVDYEVRGETGEQRPVAVYLYAFNEEPPARDAVVKGTEEAILIEGDTEEGTEEYEKRKQKEDVPLRVKFDHNQLSVLARRQQLNAVLFEIANKVDIPFEMKYEGSELVDVDFNNYTVEQVVRSLPANVRLFQRTNLTNYETTPLRLVLAPPAGPQQTTKD